ncbi:putative F-box protein At3g16210 [Triticum dicoccoides]|nr:putative F-box protein At3g16210 [Triticum dicoccoides]
MDCPKRSASAGLPEDSLVEILARVPARSVYRSKCVAKAWRDLIEDPLHRKKLPQTLQGFFLIDKETHRQRVCFTNLLDRSGPLQIDRNLAFLKESPGIGTLDFSDSCNGLLLFEHKLEAWPYNLLGYVVCNPATKQWVEVPRDGPPLP